MCQVVGVLDIPGFWHVDVPCNRLYHAWLFVHGLYMHAAFLSFYASYTYYAISNLRSPLNSG